MAIVGPCASCGGRGDQPRGSSSWGPVSTTEHAGYDYVVVGGGTAGCVLAARLAARPDVSVLFIEAGPDGRGIAQIVDPALWTKLPGTSLDWGYSYAASPHVADRSLAIPRGRVLGGCSATNAMHWYRGHPDDYDAWERAGAAGWNYRALLPYFRRAEDWEGGASGQRGAGGPMRIEPSRDPHPVAAALVAGATELGFPALDDPNGGDNYGAALANLNISEGRRFSVVDAYLPSWAPPPAPGQVAAGQPHGPDRLGRGPAGLLRGALRLRLPHGARDAAPEPGRPRGDRGARRDRHAATADPLRHRRPGRPGPARRPGDGRVARRGPQPARPSDAAGHELPRQGQARPGPGQRRGSGAELVRLRRRAPRPARGRGPGTARRPGGGCSLRPGRRRRRLRDLARADGLAQHRLPAGALTGRRRPRRSGDP